VKPQSTEARVVTVQLSSPGSHSDEMGSSTELYCPKCGTPIPANWPIPGADRCAGCGIPLGEDAYERAFLEVRTELRPYLIARVVLAVSALATLLLFCYFLFQDGQLYANSPSIPNGPFNTLLITIFAGILLGAAATAAAGLQRLQARIRLLRRGVNAPALTAIACSVFWSIAVLRARRYGTWRTDEPVAIRPSDDAESESGGSATVNSLSHAYIPVAQATPPKKTHAGAIVAIVLIVVLFIFLLTVPVSTSFTRSASTISALSLFSNDPSADVGVLNISLGGTAVAGTFSVSSGQPIAFYIINSSGVQVFSITAGEGAFSFTAGSGSYAFVAVSVLPADVSVSGSVQQPILFGLFNND
jgi:hypothetical protein